MAVALYEEELGKWRGDAQAVLARWDGAEPEERPANIAEWDEFQALAVAVECDPADGHMSNIGKDIIGSCPAFMRFKRGEIDNVGMIREIVEWLGGPAARTRIDFWKSGLWKEGD